MKCWLGFYRSLHRRNYPQDEEFLDTSKASPIINPRWWHWYHAGPSKEKTVSGGFCGRGITKKGEDCNDCYGYSQCTNEEGRGKHCSPISTVDGVRQQSVVLRGDVLFHALEGPPYCAAQISEWGCETIIEWQWDEFDTPLLSMLNWTYQLLQFPLIVSGKDRKLQSIWTTNFKRRRAIENRPGKLLLMKPNKALLDNQTLVRHEQGGKVSFENTR